MQISYSTMGFGDRDLGGGLNWASIRDALSSVDYAGSWIFEVIVPRHGEGPDELARLTRQVASAWTPES